MDDLDGITELARQAHRRIREGVLHELDERRRALVGRSSQEARMSFESLTKLLAVVS